MEAKAPDESEIASIKAKFPGRVLRLVEMVDGEDTYSFVMTGPNREEYKKFMIEMSGADKDLEKLRAAIERASLAQIRWPEREQVQALFDQKPGMVQNFAEELTKAAGTHVEVRAKNL